MPNIHTSICDCKNLDTCIRFYRRYRNKDNVIFHSLSYNKRQLSISFFVKYGSLFGSILTFMNCNNKKYAIIKRYPIKKLFSECFISSIYYGLLSKSVDQFFFILDKVASQFDIVDIHSSFDMCIVIEEEDCYVVSPLSSYYEHD